MKKRVAVNYIPGSNNDREQNNTNGIINPNDSKWTTSNSDVAIRMPGSSTIEKSGCTEDVRMGEENGIDSIYLRLRTLEEQVGSIITDKKYSLISV